MARAGAGAGWLRILWRLRGRLKTPVYFKIARRSPLPFLARVGMENALFLSRRMDLRLKNLAGLRASSLVGCVW